MSRIAAIAALVALLGSTAGCGDGSSGTPSGAPAATGSVTTAVVSSAPSVASPTPAAPANPLTGTWRGAFESKKASVTLDPGVKEAAWSADDGKAHAGKAEIDLHVGSDGVVKGKLRGALGNAEVAGTAETDTVTMTFARADADSSEALSGTIVLKLKDAKLVGDLKASSGDATIVRAAMLELTRGDT